MNDRDFAIKMIVEELSKIGLALTKDQAVSIVNLIDVQLAEHGRQEYDKGYDIGFHEGLRYRTL